MTKRATKPTSRERGSSPPARRLHFRTTPSSLCGSPSRRSKPRARRSPTGRCAWGSRIALGEDLHRAGRAEASAVQRAAVSPDLRLVVADSKRESQPVTIRELSTGRIVTTLDVRSKDVYEAQFDASGSKVLTGGGAVTLWDTRLGSATEHDRCHRIGVVERRRERIAIDEGDDTEVFETDGTLVATLPTGGPSRPQRHGTLAVAWETVSPVVKTRSWSGTSHRAPRGSSSGQRRLHRGVQPGGRRGRHR